MAIHYNLGDADYVVDKYITKQNIGRAMQAGVINPVVGTIAGMKIDRIVAAQTAQQTSMPTIVQQVFAPPAPPAPPMGAPPMGGMGPPPGAPPMGDMPPAPPMGAPQMGMADGGLAALPVPDNMFDEPSDGEFAGGGIVAFAQGDEVDYDKILRENMDYYRDPQNFMRDINAAYQPKREYAERANQYNKDLLSEEGQKKRRDEDTNAFLTRFGFELMGTPGGLGVAASRAAGKTLPGLQEATKERRAEVRDALKQLAADEGMTNAEQRAFVLEGMKGRGEAGKIAEGFAQREAQKELARMQEAGALQRANITAGATKYAADEAGRTQVSIYEKEALKRLGDVKAKAISEIPALRTRLDNEVGVAYNMYKLAVASGNETKKKEAIAQVNRAERAYVNSQVALLDSGAFPSPGKGATGSGMPALPAGFVPDQ
jgi:hypothetical protein